MVTREGYLHQQVCDYLKLRYPNVIFRTDFAAGVKMTIGQAARHKRLQAGRAYPDLFIAEPRHGCHGLFIELKVNSPYLKNGSLTSNPHVQEQYVVLAALGLKGYKAVFAVGFEEARKIIDEYLSDRQ